MKYFLIILFSLLTLLFSQQKKDLDEMDRETDQMEEDAYFFEESIQRINLNTATREDLKSLYLKTKSRGIGLNSLIPTLILFIYF